MAYQSKLKKSNIVFPIITKLINQAFYEAKNPSSLKIAEVIQISKSG